EPPISEWKIAGNQLTRSNLPSNHEKLQIFDAASRLIYERELTADIYTFSLPQVNTKGIYFINISDGIKTQNLKWVSNGSY
ncbi:MAG: T9SS type A sorting domain-containing protein, partial [Saprospiraceae bacterium]|nr:T9SS type A sorting domain-containing protein [Saprospiraceae bacterium]